MLFTVLLVGNNRNPTCTRINKPKAMSWLTEDYRGSQLQEGLDPDSDHVDNSGSLSQNSVA